MPDLAGALDYLVPAALYRGSLTANTQDAYEALTWLDPRPKPTYAQALEADSTVQKNILKAYAAQIRWERQVGGFTYHGTEYDTAFQSPTAFSTAYSMAQANPSYSTKWKAANGNFVVLTAQEIVGLVEAVQAFNDALFVAESSCVTGIDDGTITTEEQIASIINVVPNSL